MSVDDILRLASKSEGYLQGYDDAINDVLKWLRTEYPAAALDLILDIKKLNEGKSRPIEIREQTHGN